ncbi:MAG: type III-B CRISPR module-associated Cmr3 family protein [bacterium]
MPISDERDIKRDDMRFYCNVNEEIRSKALKLGSEAHLVDVKKIGNDNLIETALKNSRTNLVNSILETKTFRLVLLQPGVFKNGWFPFDYAASKEPCAQVERLNLKLLFAFTGQPIKISGYSFTTSNPGKQKEIKLKPIVNAVSIGSVYLFKITNDGCTKDMIENFVNQYDNQKIENIPYSQMGFNHVILGIGPKEEVK